jgi:hypothetical protein
MSDTQPANFRQLVKLMRDAQRAYFKARTQTNLKACLKLEMRVDNWLNRHADELGEQLALEGGTEDGDDQQTDAAP